MANTEPKQMSVGELIAELQKLPAETMVYFHDSAEGYSPAGRLRLLPVKAFPGFEYPEMVVIA